MRTGKIFKGCKTEFELYDCMRSLIDNLEIDKVMYYLDTLRHEKLTSDLLEHLKKYISSIVEG